MKIRMLIDARGAPHGHTVFDYVAGETYPQPGREVTDDLGAAFIAAGQAVDASDPEPVFEDVDTTVMADTDNDPATSDEPVVIKTRRRKA